MKSNILGTTEDTKMSQSTSSPKAHMQFEDKMSHNYIKMTVNMY